MKIRPKYGDMLPELYEVNRIFEILSELKTRKNLYYILVREWSLEEKTDFIYSLRRKFHFIEGELIRKYLKLSPPTLETPITDRYHKNYLKELSEASQKAKACKNLFDDFHNDECNQLVWFR
jgi:hypothetical protein